VHRSLRLLKPEALESRRVEVKSRRPEEEENLDRQIQKGHVVKDRELWVKSLWENVKEKGLKSLKPEQPKWMIVVDLGWTGVTRS
jgi:hypothetical protein